MNYANSQYDRNVMFESAEVITIFEEQTDI